MTAIAGNSPDDCGDWFRHVMEEIAKSNWDPAIDVITRALELHPDNSTYRQMLIGCQQERSKQEHGRK